MRFSLPLLGLAAGFAVVGFLVLPSAPAELSQLEKIRMESADRLGRACINRGVSHTDCVIMCNFNYQDDISEVHDACRNGSLQEQMNKTKLVIEQ